MSRIIHRRCLALAALLAFAVTAQAQTASAEATDLGRSHPRVADVSASPYFHVYVFQREGIRYLQINDQRDTVRAAIAVSHGVALALPIGIDAPRVSTLPQPQQGTGIHETVYHDNQVQVVMLAQPKGYQLASAAGCRYAERHSREVGERCHGYMLNWRLR